MSWLLWSLVSVVFAAATAILAKLGIAGVDSNLATAIGEASRVAPIDKLSAVFLGERLTWGKGTGVLLIAAGAISVALD